MKSYKLLLALSLSVLLLGGCGLKKMVSRYPEVKVYLENPDLETKGGKVDYTVKGTIPTKYMKKKATLTLVPTLQYNGKELALDPIKLVGEKSKETGTKIPYKAGGNFTKSGSFDFKPEYETAEMVAKGTANLKKKSADLPPVNLCDGIGNTAGRVGLSPELADQAGNGTFLLYAPHDYKQETMLQTGVIYFDLNKADLNWNQVNNKADEAKTAIKDFVNKLNENGKVDKVIITGWASPEGEESLNQGLSEKREAQAKKWFESEVDKWVKEYAKTNKMKVKDVQKPEFVYEEKSAGEDWSGFEKAVEASKIAEKNQILNVVRSQPNNTLKEQRIREMTDIYNEVKDIILPPLRRAEISLSCPKNQYSDAQLQDLAKNDPSKLSVNERLYAASLNTDLAAKSDIYDALIKDKNDDWRAYNNKAILLINTFMNTGNASNLSDAKSLLEKAAAISPNNGIILNNQAIADFFSADFTKAKSDFEASQNAKLYPQNQNYNLSTFKILAGDYDGAINSMNNRNCDYNMALTQILKKDYATAKTTLDCVKEKDAKVYYLKAVLSARTQDDAGVYSNLSQAVKLDPTYINKAKKDAEFKHYKNNAQFKDIIK